jgi:hypothetical protein
MSTVHFEQRYRAKNENRAKGFVDNNFRREGNV